MFDIGFSELMLVAIMALIILGPERLPKAARTVGLLVGRMRRTMTGIQQEIEQEVRNQEIREKLKNPMATFLNDDDARADKNLADASSQAEALASEQRDHDVLNSHLQTEIAPAPVENPQRQPDKSL
ncbi:MAG: Sec-independent protein translocase protein TatB [Bermanella sp.]